MQSIQTNNPGTCVVGELANSAAFASVAFEGAVWAKRYPAVADAVAETRKLGLVDKLFAMAATRYVEHNRTPCVSPLQGRVSTSKLEAAGFRRTDSTGRLSERL